VIVGVDVGASHTDAAIKLDDSDNVIRTRSPGCPVRRGSVQTAALQILATINSLQDQANPSSNTTCVVVGAAGTHTEELRLELESSLSNGHPTTTFSVTTDGVIALEDAFAEYPGIVVCAGSGSIAYARDHEGEIHRTGGLGPVLADEGSGFAIGLAGLRAAAKAADCRSPARTLENAIFESVGVRALDELVDWAWNADRPTIAGLARAVLEAMDMGDDAAASIVHLAARDLNELVMTLARNYPDRSPINVAFSGGLLGEGSHVRSALESEIRASLPLARIQPGSVDPVRGALALAGRLASG